MLSSIFNFMLDVAFLVNTALNLSSVLDAFG